MSLDPLDLSNLIASFDSISKFEEGDSISIREGNIEIGDPEESADWKEVAGKVQELNEKARQIIEQSRDDPQKIEHILEKIDGARQGLQRISKFFRGQSKGEEMEMTDEEETAQMFELRAGELGEQHHRLVQLLSPKEKNLADTAFQRLAGPLAGLTPEERARLKGKELEELDVPTSGLRRQKGKGGVAEMQLWGEAARVDIPRELKESIEQIAKRPEFIIIIGELTKFAKSPEFKPIGTNEWQIDLGENITLEVDTPDMGKANYILSSSVKVRLSDGKIEFLDRPLKFQVKTPSYEQLDEWYKSAKWWNFITKKAIKKAVESKKAPTHIYLNVNSIEIKGENATFNVSVIFEKGVGKRISKLIPELHQFQPISEFLELLKAVKPE